MESNRSRSNRLKRSIAHRVGLNRSSGGDVKAVQLGLADSQFVSNFIDLGFEREDQC